MSRIPAHLGRVATLMQSQSALSTIARTNLELLRTREQITTGLAVGRVSDDPVRAAAVLTLDDQIERSAQRIRNLSHADAALGALDTALGDATDLAAQAKDIASRQLSFGSSAVERAGQAVVVGQMLTSLFQLTRRTGVAGYLFGASQPGQPPVEEYRGGYRVVARGEGLITDTGAASGIPITLGVGSAVGALSARQRGTVDLNPELTRDTRLADLGGARGTPITLGAVEFSFGSGPRASVDLTGADTAGNVADRLTAAIRAYETANGVTVLGPGGITVSGGSLSIDVVAGTPPPELRFFDIGSGVTAKDLGLTSDPPTAFTSAAPLGADLNPRLTWLTPVARLSGVSGPLGSIRISNAGAARTIDLSAAQTLGDVKRLIESADLGVRVEINPAGTGIDVINEVSAGAAGAMAIEEVAGGNSTATRLGLRTLAADTPLSVFNHGRGVQVIDGRTNPVTGTADPSLNTDMSITLGDGRSFVVDLRPQDVVSVQTVIDRINAQAAAAGISSADFSAGLVDGANGIALRQNASFPGALSVRAENNSTAPEQLGLLSGSWDPASARLLGQDRARVRVDSLFSQLIDLRENLVTNNPTGISLAGEGLDRSARSLAETRGLVGALAQRVDFAAERETDLDTLNQTVRSQFRDADFASAASRFALLQTQLEAGLRVTSQAGTLSLLNFLG